MHFCAPSGADMVVEPPDSGVKRMVLDVKGRVRRWKMDAIVYALRRPAKRRTS